MAIWNLRLVGKRSFWWSGYNPISALFTKSVKKSLNHEKCYRVLLIALLILFQIELHIALNNTMTSCQDFDSLFPLLNNGCSSLIVRSCSVNTVPGEYMNKIKTLKSTNACMNFRKERNTISCLNFLEIIFRNTVGSGIFQWEPKPRGVC